MFRKLLKQVTSLKPKQPAKQTTSAPASSAEPPMAHSIEATEANFATEVLARTGPVIVDFWAEWCQPCTIVEGYLAALSREFPGQLTIASVDVDVETALAEQYQIMGLPTLLFLRDGVEVERVTGVEAYADLHARVAELLQGKSMDGEPNQHQQHDAPD